MESKAAISTFYVKLVDAGTPLRLTSSPADEWAPAWSPDARYIAFCRDFSDHGEIWMIPALGGAERRLGEVTLSQWTGCGLSWSPDGKYLAYMDKNAPRESYGVFLLSVETGTSLVKTYLALSAATFPTYSQALIKRLHLKATAIPVAK